MNHFYNHKDFGICLTVPGLIWLGYSENTLWAASKRNSSSWPFTDHPEDGRKKLLPWGALTTKKKEEISGKLRQRMGCAHSQDEPCKCGDLPYYTSIEPIQDMIVKDLKAEDYFMSYRFTNASGDPESLPSDKIKHYTNEASLLNMIIAADNDGKGIIKEQLGFKSIADFWIRVQEVIKIEKTAGRIGAKFPTSYVKLVAAKNSALKMYRANGYQSLVHGNYGKQNAAKVTDKVAEDQLLKLIEDPRQLDDVFICMLYSTWAEQNGYKTISVGTVRNYRIAKGFETDLGRRGVMAYNEKYVRQAKGYRPTGPLYLVEHDDNNLDFLFQDGKYQFHRYVAVVVADGYNDLVLGKSYRLGDTPQQWQIHQAYIDAMYYIRSLTGGWHLPFEIKSDNWAVKSLTPFYEKIATRIPAGRGNKHRGYIEQLFGTHHWKRAQQTVSQDNWNANNITAKNSGVNPDMLAQSLRDKTRPMIGNDAEKQIEQFFALAQKMPFVTKENLSAAYATGGEGVKLPPSKEQLWLEAWNKTHADDKRPISDMLFLTKFGITHQPKHTDTIMITNRGIEPQINKVQYSYELPEAWMYRKYIGAKVRLIYDPYDMSRILVTNNDDIQFIAKAEQLVPRALHDAYTGSRTYLNALLGEKKEQWNEAYEAQESRRMVANGYPAAEAILKSGVFTKDVMKEAESALIEGPGFGSAQPAAGVGNGDEYTQWLDNSNDLDQFFNNKAI